MEQRNISPPAAITAAVIHPERKFAVSDIFFLLSLPCLTAQPPPKDLAGLEEYIRDTFNKEIPRELIEFGAELGAGEFGAVFEGMHAPTPCRW